MFWIKDPKNDKPSVSLTLLIVGFFTVLAKFLLSGVLVGTVTFGELSAADFGIAISPLAMLYWGRRSSDKKEE